MTQDKSSELEPHILTNKDDTKEAPCRSCGRPCIVTKFATLNKVACNDCKNLPIKKTTTLIKDERGKIVGIQDEISYSDSTVNVDEPALPFWPDGNKKERTKLSEIAVDEYNLRHDLHRARIEKSEDIDKYKEELDILISKRKELRKNVVEKSSNVNPYSEYKDNNIYKLEWLHARLLNFEIERIDYDIDAQFTSLR